jgi:hypothetical protein
MSRRFNPTLVPTFLFSMLGINGARRQAKLSHYIVTRDFPIIDSIPQMVPKADSVVGSGR